MYCLTPKMSEPPEGKLSRSLTNTLRCLIEGRGQDFDSIGGQNFLCNLINGGVLLNGGGRGRARILLLRRKQTCEDTVKRLSQSRKEAEPVYFC